MSRLAKKPIEIPQKVEVKSEKGLVTVKGPLGELSRNFRPEVEIEVKEEGIVVSKTKDTPFVNSLWGTYASHVINMINGVTSGYEKKLVVEGVGYKVDLKGDEIVLALGFSHPVSIKVPEGIKASVEKNKITVSGINKEKVGEFAAKIKSLKKPEPYGGKGIRYEGEQIRRKVGKKTVS